MVHVLFLFLTRFHVNVAPSNGNPTCRAFQSYGVMLRFTAEAIFWRPLSWKWGNLLLWQKPPFAAELYKRQCSLGKFQKESEKEIDWVVWAWLQRDDGGGICCLLQAHYTWAKKQIKLKSLGMDGNPRKRKHVAICKQLFPASPPWGKRKFSLQKLTHAYYAFASYARREGHLYEVFLVLAKTCLI